MKKQSGLTNAFLNLIADKRICLLLALLVSSSALGQTYHFASHGGGSKKEELLDFKVDDAENSYALIKYDSNVSFGGDSYSNKAKNSLIVKYDKNGNQLMTKDIVAEGSNALFGALGVSDDGMIVVASTTKAGALDGHEVYGGTFIGRLGADGDFDWVLQPIPSIERVRQFLEFRVTAIEVEGNSIYVAATADGKITLNGFTDPGYAHDNTQSALLIKLNTAGNVLWIKNIPTPDVKNHPTIDGGMDHILPSADGTHIYVAGKVGGGSYNPYEVAYVAKFKTDGDFLWVKRTSSSGSDSWGLAETRGGDLITGFGVGGAQVIDFGDGALLDASETGWFGALMRLDSDGNVKTLRYVADALYSDKSSIGPANLLRIHHVAVNESDQAILVGEVGGSHPFKNGIAIESTPGLVAAARDVILVVSDLDFNPLEAYANTGSNNEWGRKCVTRGNTVYLAGEYESFSHPFLGSFRAQFGEFAFDSAGDQDIFVTSLSTDAPPVPATPTVPALNLEIARRGSTLVLSWPGDISDAVLLYSVSLIPDSWEVLEAMPTLENGRWQLTLPNLEADVAAFYQLQLGE